MEYVKFNNGEYLSRLGMGAMRLPTRVDKPDQIDDEKAQEIINTCMAHGINYYDTAYIYHGGKSEVFLGAALQKYQRDSYYLADKFNLQANPDFHAQFDEQLGRLNTDYIDFYLLHGIQDQTIDDMLSCGCIDYFESMKKSGKIRYLGFSFHGTPAGMRRLLEARCWDFVQIQLNYFDWIFGDAKTLYDMADEAGLPIMVMEPLLGGKLATLTPEASALLTEYMPQRSVASWAMRWLMNLPRVAVVLSGMSILEQVEDNLKTFSEYEPLDDRAQTLIKQACDLFRPAIAVNCTSCRYCCEACPKDLDIPRLLGIYNEVKVGGAWRVSFLESLDADKRPSACTACGACTGHCPQNIDIPRWMKELASISESM